VLSDWGRTHLAQHTPSSATACHTGICRCGRNRAPIHCACIYFYSAAVMATMAGLLPLVFVFSFLVLTCLVLSCLVLSCLVLSCLVLSCLVLSCADDPRGCRLLSCLDDDPRRCPPSFLPATPVGVCNSILLYMRMAVYSPGILESFYIALSQG